MDLLYLFILGGLTLFLAFIGYRYYVFKVGFANYFSFCINYCALMNKHNSFLKEVVKVWPMRLWLWDLGNWTLDKYIINQDMYQEMLEDMEKEAVKILAKMKAIMEAGDNKVASEDMIATVDESPKQNPLTPPQSDSSRDEKND